MFLSNSATDDNKRVSVMAAAVPSDLELNRQSLNELFLCGITYQSVTYQSVTSIVKQCAKSVQLAKSNSMLTESSAITAGNSGGRGKNNGNRGRPTKEEYEVLMKKHSYNLCGK